MGFNYAKEKAEFERQWASIRKQYEDLGMNQDAIEELHDFDWDWFKSRRRYINHITDLPEEVAVEAIQQASTETSPGDIPISCGLTPSQWLDEIEDEHLLRQLMLLSDDDLDLLACLAFKGYTQREVAQQKHQNQQAISRQFQQIKNFLKNMCKNRVLNA